VKSREFRDELARRAHHAGLTVSSALEGRLETYYRLLVDWNAKINLTSLDVSRVTPEAVDRVLIEPLVAARHAPVWARRLVDIGSGGGSPAIPFALAAPSIQLLMVESRGRKAVFLKEALRALEMTDCEVATTRYEELLPRPERREAYDLLTVRAVRIGTPVLMRLQAFLAPRGQMFLFRGTGSPEEAPGLPLRHAGTHPLIELRGSQLVIFEKLSEDSVTL
jgi:16S rRNA (guanine527-N7)-methyltransferase